MTILSTLTANDLAADVRDTLNDALARTSNVRTPYLGPVATGVAVPNASISVGTGSWAMSRSAHWTRDRMTNPTLLFSNWSLPVTYIETVLTGGTIKASIELTDGTIIACSGGATVSAVNGFYTLTCPVDVPANTKFYVRTLQVNATNGVNQWGSNVLNAFASDEGFLYGTGTPNDLVAGGAVANAYQRRQSYGPIAILAQTTKRTFQFFGTSKEKGINDKKSDAYGDLGTTARLFGRTHAYIDVSVATSTLQSYMSASHPYLDALSTYVTDIVNIHGINDIQSNADTPATLSGRRTSFAARSIFATKRIIGGTLSPYASYTNGVSVSITSLTRSGTTATATVASTASLTTGQTVNVTGVTGSGNTDFNGPKVITVASGTTFTYPVDASAASTAPGTITYNDAFSTLAAQNIGTANQQNVLAFNTLARGGISGESQLLDIADFEDPLRTGRWPVSRDPAATTGNAGFATTDGLHENTTMLEIMRDRGAGRVAQLGLW